MDRRNLRDDIDITKEELNQISEALKKEEFRKLFIDYVDDITDPKNKELYEKELTEYERERGIDVTFIHPKAGYVIKTSVDGCKKAFINVCENDHIGKPTASRAVKGGSSGTEWSLPYIQAPPRDDLDKNRKLCVVYDVIFHPLTLELAKKDQRIKSFTNDTALAAVENSFNVKLDRNNLKFPKMGFKGYKHPCIIRKKINAESCRPSSSDIPLESIIPNPQYPYCEPVSEPAILRPKHEGIKGEYTVPKYQIKHRKNLDLQEFTYSSDAKMNSCVANELHIEVNLPLIRSTSEVELLLSEKTLALKSESPAKYKLDISLPYNIIENESTAKFDRSSRKLIVTAVVDRQKHCLTREDSGLESDPSRGMSSSSDEDLSKLCTENSTDAFITDISNKFLTENCVNCKDDDFSVDSHEDVDIENDSSFLNCDTYYSLPVHTLHTTPKGIIFDISVKNIEPSSISHIFSAKNSQFQIKMYSMGSGFVPINYSACLKLNSLYFEAMSLAIDVHDSAITVHIDLKKNSSTEKGAISIGKDPLHLEEPLTWNKIPSSPVIPKPANNAMSNRSKKESGDVILKLSKLILYSTAEDDSDDYENEETEESNYDYVSKQDQADDISTTKCMNKSSSNKIEKKMRRTHSESGCALPLAQRRSILKDSRSLSESNANDYCGFSLSMESEDGCGSQEIGHVKKQVRFSETILKKVFRANSSILGQRKKNQRKARNKKRSSERRNSESSGISESEISELEVSEVSDLSEVSDISETSESDDGSTNDGPTNAQTPGSKGHRRKGKKNHRKSANTAKINCLFDTDG